jgi:hypothetical protein
MPGLASFMYLEIAFLPPMPARCTAPHAHVNLGPFQTQHACFQAMGMASMASALAIGGMQAHNMQAYNACIRCMCNMQAHNMQAYNMLCACMPPIAIYTMHTLHV